MKRARVEKIADWILLALLIGSVMIFGYVRFHQLALNGFLLASFGVIVALLFIYRLVYRRWFMQKDDQQDETIE